MLKSQKCLILTLKPPQIITVSVVKTSQKTPAIRAKGAVLHKVETFALYFTAHQTFLYGEKTLEQRLSKLRKEISISSRSFD